VRRKQKGIKKREVEIAGIKMSRNKEITLDRKEMKERKRKKNVEKNG
jgi:hypothetical protein